MQSAKLSAPPPWLGLTSNCQRRRTIYACARRQNMPAQKETVLAVMSYSAGFFWVVIISWSSASSLHRTALWKCCLFWRYEDDKWEETGCRVGFLPSMPPHYWTATNRCPTPDVCKNKQSMRYWFEWLNLVRILTQNAYSSCSSNKTKSKGS